MSVVIRHSREKRESWDPRNGSVALDPRFLAGVTVTQCKDGRYFRPDTYLNLNCAVVRDSGISNRICASEG